MYVMLRVRPGGNPDWEGLTGRFNILALGVLSAPDQDGLLRVETTRLPTTEIRAQVREVIRRYGYQAVDEGSVEQTDKTYTVHLPPEQIDWLIPALREQSEVDVQPVENYPQRFRLKGSRVAVDSVRIRAHELLRQHGHRKVDIQLTAINRRED